MPVATILPATFFDGLSTLWGGCAYVASAIVASGLVFQIVRSRPDGSTFIWLLTKVFFIGLSTVFLREWLMRLNDVVNAFGAMMGVDPCAVDNRFVQYISGKTASDPNSSVWDIIWGTKSIGTAISYAFLWLLGWLSWGVQYIVKLIGGVLLTTGWAISPIFLSFFMIRSMAGVGQKFILGLIALVCWPFGWVIAAVVTNAMLDAAATAHLVPVIEIGAPLAVPALTVLLIGSWMLISSILAPWITTKILLMGANPASALAQGMGGVMQAAFSGGSGAAVAAATGGAGVPAIMAAAVGGTMSAGAESAVRGGGSARTTSSAIGGMSGFYSGNYWRRQVQASEDTASSSYRRASAAETMASTFADHAQRQQRGRSGFDSQPHNDDPNRAAADIDSNAKS